MACVATGGRRLVDMILKLRVSSLREEENFGQATQIGRRWMRKRQKVLQDTLMRWGKITVHPCGGIKHKAMLIKVTKHPRLHARTKHTELPKVSKVSKVPIYVIRNIPAQPNPNIHARPQHAFPSNLKSLNYIPTNNLFLTQSKLNSTFSFNTKRATILCCTYVCGY